MATVLIVDDDAAFAHGLADALSARRFRTVVRTDGDSALDAILDEPVAVALCDIVMPGLLGPGFLQKVHSIPRHQKLPVVFMSTLPESRVHSMFDGYFAYLQKPFAMSELLGTLDRALALGGDDGATSPRGARRDATGAVGGPVFRVR